MTSAYYFPNRADAPSDTEWQKSLDQQTHPLTSHRLSVMADWLEGAAADVARMKPAAAQIYKTIAVQFQEFGKFLEDTEFQLHMRNAAVKNNSSTLREHR